MNPLLPVLAVYGWLTLFFSATMLVPLAVAWLGHEPAASRHAYGGAVVITAISGIVMWAVSRRSRRELQPRDGVLLVVLTWAGLPLFASLPLLAYFHQAGAPISFTDAYFEAVSGLTTSGGTVLTGLDALPLSVNLWRCLLQWIGGMGILVLAVAILPLLGMGGSQLFRAEASGPIKDAKHTPRIAETAKGLWGIYLGLSLACLLAYRAGGMGWADAWMHMFTTVSLGGLSSHDASFGFFQSPLLEAICVVFMVLGSGSFALYFVAVHKRSPGLVLRDTEWRATMLVLVLASLFVAALLLVKDHADGLGHALRIAVFNVVSIASTTGFATVDYTQWPALVPILLLLLSGLASSAGSAGAGVKMIRVLILLKLARREMVRMLHPRMVRPVMVGGRQVPTDAVFAVFAFMLVYGAVLIGLTLVLLATDLPFDIAFSAVVASLNNMGPGLSEVGPAGNFKGLSDFQTWVCSLAMLLGRLEILSVLVLMTPGYWRR